MELGCVVIAHLPPQILHTITREHEVYEKYPPVVARLTTYGEAI